jgi:uncharacterized protein with FMN-binding domain
MGYLRAIAVIVLLCAVAGTDIFAFNGEFCDGAYPGEYSFVSVEVIVQGGKVDDIKMVKHGGGGSKYAEMIQPLISKVLEQQSIDIDAVTGATVSSEHFKKAVADALDKARKQ